MSLRPCPECKGARLRPESRAVLVGGHGDPRVHARCRCAGRSAWLDELELTETERHIARLILREIDERLRFLDNVGRRLPVAGPRGGDAVGRRGAAHPAGDADRLVAGRRALHPRRAVDRPAPARQRQADRDARAAARPRQHRARRRARRGDDARGRPPRSTWGRARASTAAASSPQGTAAQVDAGQGVADRPVPGRHARDRGAGAAAHAVRATSRSAARAAQPQERRRQGAARRPDLRHRRVGLGQVDAGQRGALQGGRQPAAPRAAAAGRAHRGAGARAARQDHPDRPVADRPHAALEPGDLHRAVRRHPRPVLQDAGGAGARLQAGPLLVQRQGRPLRGLPRRRPDQDRDALPARRLRAVRAVPRQALQPRDARGPLQGQDDRRRARHARRGGASSSSSTSRRSTAGWRRCATSASATSASASRRRRCRAARRSASSSRPSCRRSRPGGRSTSSTSRRPACTSPTSSGCSRCCTGWSTRATRSS